MDVVFRFAKEITVLVQGAVFTQGTPDEIMANEQVRAVYLGQESHQRRPPWLSRALELDNVRAGYGETVVLEDIRLALAPARRCRSSAATASARRTLLATIMGHTTLHGGARPAARQGHLAACHLSARDRRARLRAAGARDLSLADACARTSKSRRGRGRGRYETVFELFPRLAERAGNRGNQLVGRRAADAGHRPRADRQSDACC